jgi:hypothetical protein
MLVDLEIYPKYFVLGLFITWSIIYLNLPEPEIYELKKEKFNNKCF